MVQSQWMRWSLLLGLTALVSSVAVQASESGAAEEAEARAVAAQPFLWQVEGPQGPSWLFGTIHLGVALEEVAPVVAQRLSEADSVALEADIRQIDPMALMELAQLPGEQRLDELLPRETWQALKDQLGALLPEERLVRMQPWFLQTVLVTMAVPPVVPMDLAILQSAAERDQPLRFFEHWREQLAIMNQVPPSQPLQELTRWFEDNAELIGEVEALMSAYRAGDEAGVRAIVLDPEDMAEFPELYEATLFERNRAWLPTIEELVQEGGAFVAVGLGHLVGEQSVIELLRSRGYTVERVSVE